MKAEAVDEQELLMRINLECCKTYRPTLFAELTDLRETQRYQLVSDCGPQKVNNLYDSHFEALYYEMQDPLGSIAEHTEGCLTNIQGIILCLGFGLGYAPLMLVQQKNYVSRSIIVIEPDPEVLLKAFRSIDCTDLISSPDMLLLVGKEISQIGPAVFGHITQNRRLMNSKNFQIVDLPASVKANGDYFSQSVEATKGAIVQGVKSIGNCTDDCLLGLDSALANFLPHAALPPVKGLAELFVGKPAIVVSSGPSLDKNIDLLREVGNQAVVIAADASLRMMTKKGLKPHFVTSVERTEATAKLFEGLSESDFKDVHLVGSPICHYRTFELFQGPQISTEREHGFFEVLNLGKGKLVPGPSAGNMAFRLAQYMGCDPIILIGQDLAVSDDGKTHASGNKYGDKIEGYLRDPLWLKGNYQELVRSNPVLKMFHQAYEYDVSLATQRVINSTEGGAKISGSEVMALQDALAICLDSGNDNSTTIVDCVKTALQHPPDSLIEAIIDQGIANLEHSLTYLDSVHSIIDEALENSQFLAEKLAKSAEIGEPDIPTASDPIMVKINMLSGLSAEPEFKKIAMDMVQPIFFHTMADYIHALSLCENNINKAQELIKNTENLANNFKVILRFVERLVNGHLDNYRKKRGDTLIS